MSSKNAIGADNQQGSKKIKRISDDYFAGFTDGEGCFYTGFSKRNDLPFRWQIITEFHLSQNPKGKIILEEFKKRIGCGYIKQNHPDNTKDKSLVLIIKKQDELREKLIPFFEKHPLYSGKKNDFEVFRKTLYLMKEKKHLTRSGFRNIVNDIFARTDLGKRRYSKEEILSNF